MGRRLINNSWSIHITLCLLIKLGSDLDENASPCKQCERILTYAHMFDTIPFVRDLVGLEDWVWKI